MDNLIAILEAAKEGSRELSDECLLAVGWWWCPEHECYVRPDGQDWRDELPDPTRNLQDALDWMMSNGWSVQAYIHPDVSHITMYRLGPVVSLTRNIVSGPAEADATTPALALCAAALKARETMKENGDASS